MSKESRMDEPGGREILHSSDGAHRGAPVDAVQFISQGIEMSGVPMYSGNRDKRIRAKKIQEWLCEYHADGTPPARRKELKDRIVMNTWFLLPFILSSKRFPAALFEDALQNMVIEIIKAIDNFKPELGHKFTSYISGYLKNAVSLSARDNSVVRVPASARRTAQVQTTSLGKSHGDAGGCTITSGSGDVYDEENVGQDRALPRHTSVQGAEQEYAAQMGISAGLEESVMHLEVMGLLEQALSEDASLLTKKERLVITYRFGIFGAPRLTLEDVAHIFHGQGWNATKEWIYQIEQKAKKKLRAHLRAHGVTNSRTN